MQPSKTKLIDVVDSIVRKEPIDFGRVITNSERPISAYVLQLWLSQTNEFEYVELLNMTSNRLMGAFQDDPEMACKLFDAIIPKSDECNVKFTKNKRF